MVGAGLVGAAPPPPTSCAPSWSRILISRCTWSGMIVKHSIGSIAAQPRWKVRMQFTNARVVGFISHRPGSTMAESACLPGRRFSVTM